MHGNVRIQLYVKNLPKPNYLKFWVHDTKIERGDIHVY